ncbi:MAG: tRNA (adenosine(37)-N6)-threonylcarbamoyltransferase complex transferase subunit TsaD [Planctomycetes bacterium]|nr:tRNA (adenosine(37)-N6)-threonylcarbamoyltransferase complex transferase subunit TsaD [Planctomycetota bacterium]
MNVLGIETSCDETSVSVVRDGRMILSNVIRSQIEQHAPYRGVVPEIACRAHTEEIDEIFRRALMDAEREIDQIDAIAVTNTPGLIGALIVGVSFAKGLAMTLEVPLIGVNHVDAHVYSAMMADDELAYPYACLAVSGGHTHAFLVTAFNEMELLGATIDDAAGEAFDKAAAILELPYPGGPSISKAAMNGDPESIRFKRTFIDSDEIKFSFSGVKTALLYHVRGQNKTRWHEVELTEKIVCDAAAAFQECVVDVLVSKAMLAVRKTGVKSLAIVGGVAANKRLRERLANECAKTGAHLSIPPIALCTDNAAMIAGLGYQYLANGYVSDLDLSAVPT